MTCTFESCTRLFVGAILCSAASKIVSGDFARGVATDGESVVGKKRDYSCSRRGVVCLAPSVMGDGTRVGRTRGGIGKV